MNFIRRFTNCNNKLHNIDEQKLKNFVPKIKECKVIKVYDGECYKFKVRLDGIDSAEIKGSSENEKKHAIQARDALSDKILHQIVKLDIKGLEKYGRILADVFYNGENMNEWMLNNGYAVKYDGGTKKRDEKWDHEL